VSENEFTEYACSEKLSYGSVYGQVEIKMPELTSKQDS
jgi:hypothetical protein